MLGGTNMNTVINQLVSYALQHHLINKDDINYSVNLLLDLLGICEFIEEETEPASLDVMMEQILEYAVEHHLIENTMTEKDLFDTRVMNCFMPRPSEVIKTFNLLKKDPEKATDYYYDLSIHSNYIRKTRTDKNIKFNRFYKYGEFQISINLSKPEKDPKEIAKAKLVKSSGYPKCLLCKENVGFAGNMNYPARQNHRIIPVDLNGNEYYLQYSPYVYYNEHCIILNKEHVPMKINRITFENLFGFIRQFPHYMIGSNADLPIVGGSILSHDHFQGGKHHFPIEDAEVLYETQLNEKVDAQILNWPLSTLRLSSLDENELIEWSERILNKWIDYQDEEQEIIAYTNGERHNTITPIVRKKGEMYQIDLVLRNNRTSEKYPDGIFHPHPEYHHVKKENIGLIEVMGLAILPARLKTEIEMLKDCLLNGTDIDQIESLQKHKEWFNRLKQVDVIEDNIDELFENELTCIFVGVLENAGVFKMNEDGIRGFEKFLKTIMEEG